MLKGKLAACCLVASALLVASGTAFAGVIDACNSTASVVLAGQAGTPVTASVCPSGDAENFGVQGFYISATIEDGLGVGIPGILASDFWLDDCDALNDLIVLCGGSASSNADSLTNSLGKTTMSNTSIAGGDCALGVIVLVQGAILDDPATSCTTKLCLPVYVKSYDLTGDLNITLGDLTTFAQGYPPNAFEVCTDYSGNGTNNLADLATFALHFGPPGHECP
jgi:hypothetical protein